MTTKDLDAYLTWEAVMEQTQPEGSGGNPISISSGSSDSDLVRMHSHTQQ